MKRNNLMKFLLINLIIIYLAMIEKINSVSHHFIKRTNAQQRQIDKDTELEEELDSDNEEGILFDKIISSSGEENNIEEQQQIIIQKQQQFGKDTVFEQGETRDFLHFLRRIKYDHRQCPQNEGKPVFISVSVVISNIRAVSEVTMDYSLEMFYREIWMDKRLRYDIKQFRNKTELSLHESYSNFLWHPDTFMPNAIASKNPRKQSISHRSLLRLQSDGQILYSRRLSVVAECPMDLTLFPFDSQICKLGIESYGYTSDQVQYIWSFGQRAALKLHKIRLPDFRIKEAFVTQQIENYATGNYSRLYVCFVFSRSAGFCFLQLIIPSTAVVITSWVSLWMENETSFQDMISIILTITFLLFSYNEVMPRVSYLKALDIWLAVCFMIVFLSLIKLAIMKYMRQRLQNTLLAGLLPYMPKLMGEINNYYYKNNLNKNKRNKQNNINNNTNKNKKLIKSSAALNLGFSSNFNYSSSSSIIQNIQKSNKRPPTPPPHLKQLNINNNNFVKSSQYFINSLKENRRRILLLNKNKIKNNFNSSRSPINSIRIGIESTNSSSNCSTLTNNSENEEEEEEENKDKLFFCFDHLGNIEFSNQFMRRFHWISQMGFFFGFVLFCLYFFLVYPNSRLTTFDPACQREKAEWFASIPL
ncbi:hypothetical protein Mgra_00001931 [Meloidogyne graminicola]|uniref:Uncharacterized protein n=1 Tax=Meloidogyne graminicola TaxID=189291 RepID=A0A8S9ZXT1_9BILA|nr:hypothetical protein Mgra_00001931 [Meloidogyne graminicola]